MVHRIVCGMVHGTVHAMVHGMVMVHGTLHGLVHGMVHGMVHGTVHCMVHCMVQGTVHGTAHSTAHGKAQGSKQAQVTPRTHTRVRPYPVPPAHVRGSTRGTGLRVPKGTGAIMFLEAPYARTHIHPHPPDPFIFRTFLYITTHIACVYL